MFNKLVNKKMLEGMFGDSFEINGGIKKISLDNYNGIAFDVITKKLPVKVPKKWMKENYNAISFTLRFVFIEEFKVEGVFENEEVCFEIFEKNERVFIISNRDSFKMLCKSEFFYIENISYYLDERWD